MIALLTLTVAVNVVYAYGTCAFCEKVPFTSNYAFSSVGTIGLQDGNYYITAEVDQFKSKTAFFLGTTLFTYVGDRGDYEDSGSASGFVGGYDIISDEYSSDSDSDSN